MPRPPASWAQPSIQYANTLGITPNRLWASEMPATLAHYPSSGHWHGVPVRNYGTVTEITDAAT